MVPSYFHPILLIFSSRLFLHIKTTELFSFPCHRPQEALFLPKPLLLVPKSPLSFDTIVSLSFLSICSSLRLAHKSCILLTSVVSPALAQVLLSSSRVFPQKNAQFNSLARKKSQIYYQAFYLQGSVSAQQAQRIPQSLPEG